MFDMKINKQGDIEITQDGDFALTDSICQAIEIRLKWIYNEWRLCPDFGLRWFEDIFVKNPNLDQIRRLIRDEILGVEGVKDAEVTEVIFDPEDRGVVFKYICYTDYETFEGEVTIDG